MKIPELYERAVDEFDARMAKVGDDQWHVSTPCTEWDVHALVNHVVNEALWVQPLLAGKTLDEVGDSLDGDLLGADPKAAWARARDEELAAVSRLSSLDRMVHVSWGQIPARDYLSQVLMDHLIHGWDLARATGSDDRLAPEVVDFCLEQVEPMEEAIRSSGVYGDRIELPPGAGSQARLLALLGRRP